MLSFMRYFSFDKSRRMFRDPQIAAEMDMDVADKGVLVPEPFGRKILTAAVAERIDLPRRALPDLRIVELVSPVSLAPAADDAVLVQQDLAVTEARFFRHSRLEGKHAGHGEEPVVEITDALRKVHQPAAFGIQRFSGVGPCMDRPEHGPVAGQLFGMELGIPAPDIDGVCPVRDGPVDERAEPEDLRAGIPEQVQVVFIIETERLVIGDGEPEAPLFPSDPRLRGDVLPGPKFQPAE